MLRVDYPRARRAVRHVAILQSPFADDLTALMKATKVESPDAADLIKSMQECGSSAAFGPPTAGRARSRNHMHRAGEGDPHIAGLTKDC